MESLVTLAITGTECMANKQTDILLYIYRLAEVSDISQDNLTVCISRRTKQYRFNPFLVNDL